jgi:hypothetical protein
MVLPEVLIDNKQNRQNNILRNKNTHLSIKYLSISIIAFICFALINIFCWQISHEDKELSKDLWGGVGSIDLAIGQYNQLTEKPNVVLLGSSLMMYPFWAMDKEKHPQISDIFHHRYSLSMQDELSKAGVKQPCVYSFAIFGQMISDAYIYVDEYLKENKTPQYLVFGIAPRDFSDYDLPAPMDTLTFKRLIGLNNFAHYALLYLPKLEDKIDFSVNHLCFFYSRRWRLQHEIDKALNKAYAFFGINISHSKKPSENTAGFMLAGSEDVRFQNSLNEYKRRYRNIAEKDLSIQMGFLSKLLSVCHNRHIKVILVNLPLTKENVQLLPEGFYKNFSKQIANIASENQAKYLDLGENSKFNRSDFWDTTHLNHAGGKKLLTEIMPYLQD